MMIWYLSLMSFNTVVIGKDNLCLHENIDGNFQLNLGSMHLNLNFVHQLQHLLWVLDKGDIEL